MSLTVAETEENAKHETSAGLRQFICLELTIKNWNLRSTKWGFNGDCAPQQFWEVHVRFGSKADMGEYLTDVRFTPKSRHRMRGHWDVR